MKNGKNSIPDQTDLSYGRIPPQAVEIEEAVLGAILIEKDAQGIAFSLLDPEHFYKESHQIIYQALREMKEKNTAIDLLTLVEHLKRTKRLDEIGGPYYLTTLTSKVATASHLLDHILILKDKYIFREAIRIGHDLQKIGYEEDLNIDVILANISTRLTALTDVSDIFGENFKDIIGETLSDIKGKQEGTIRIGLKTGYNGIDKIFDFCSNNIIFISAIEKAGKTKFLINIIVQLFLNNNDIGICWYSMEDDKMKVIRNMIAILTGIQDEDQQSKHKKISEEDLNNIIKATEAFKNFDIEIIDRPTTIDKIASHFDRFCLRRHNKINILAIDNFNICRDMERDLKDDLSRENYICGRLQQINRENNVDNRISFTLVLDHLSPKQFPVDALKDGYRPKAKFVLGTSRKNQIVTQLFLLNRPSMFDDLMDEERTKANITINNEVWKREDVLRELLVGQMARNRNGTIDERYAIVRFLADYGTMDIREWYNADVDKAKNIQEFQERGIYHITQKQFMDEMFIINSEGHPQQTCAEVNYILGKEDVIGKKISFDFLIQRYKEYYNYKLKLQANDPQYTAKDNRIRPILTWIRESMYNQRFKKGTTSREISRDYYLYNIKD